MTESIPEVFRVASSLGEEEKNTLRALSKTGAAIPAELAVRTFTLPEETNKTIRALRERNLVDTERGSRGTSLSSGDVVYLNDLGRMVAQYLSEMKK